VPGEELRGVIPATTFLKQFNLVPETRLSGTVAVVGGGSTAMDAARSALRAGAQRVHILYRRTRAEMPAQVEEVRAAVEEGIDLQELVAPIRLNGASDSRAPAHVVSITCQRMHIGEPDADGRRRPVPIPGSEFDLLVDNVLVAVGEAPDPSFLPEGTSVQVNAWGGLLINPETLATGAPGVFAAGDVTYGPKTVIHAAAHGRKAARAIHAYLRGITPRDVTEMPDDEGLTVSTLAPDGHVMLDLRPTPREVMPLRSANATHDRAEFALGLTEEQARCEASRCLRCDLAYLCPAVKLAGSETTVPSTVATVAR
jgi:NADPH-dependent glutamate synthase beta subunit-like oxidoreductase